MTLIALFLAFFANVVLAGNVETNIHAIALEHRLNESNSKHYNQLLDELRNEGLAFNLIIKPLRRAQVGFKTDPEGCTFPATINAIYTNDIDFKSIPLISSVPIDRISLQIFTAAKKQPITSYEQLSGKRVAILNGVNPSVFLKDIEIQNIETIPNEEILIKMLNANRVDFAIGFSPDILLAAEAINQPNPVFNNKLSLFRNEGASLVCKDTELNRKLVTSFNKIINKLKKSDQLRKILGKHADIVPIQDS